jgi:hypothetical protein
MPRSKKHPHDPFPDDFGQWATCAAWAVLILGWLAILGEFYRFIHG